MVVDDRTGLSQITNDISKGLMQLTGVSRLLLMVGRADVIAGRDTRLVLERLDVEVQHSGFQGTVLVVGALPNAKDDRERCEELMQQWKVLQDTLKEKPRMHFVQAADVMCDEFGVIPQLLDRSGLTLDGIRELKDRLTNI